MVDQPTPLWGAGLFAGYRYGQGDFPTYDGERATNAGGELRAGASLPLLRNGAADRRRTQLGRAEAEAQGQQEAVQAQRLEVRRLAENQQLPALDVSLAVSKDFGAGDGKLDKTDVEAALSFEFPLPNRFARGKAQAVSGALLRVLEQERLLRDRAAVEVGDAESALSAARERVRLAGRELEVATELEQAEWHRFELGDGHLLFVNLREVARAEAAVREVDALADFHKAAAAFRAATAAPLP